jgi:hypothetical protein
MWAKRGVASYSKGKYNFRDLDINGLCYLGPCHYGTACPRDANGGGGGLLRIY